MRQSPCRACGRAPSAPATRAGSQAGRQLAAQHSPTLDEQGLIDGFVADAHRRVVREVDLQPSGNLLRAPGPSPSPILSRTMPAALPRNGRTRDKSAARGHDDAGKSLLDISAQRRVKCKLGWFRPTGRPIGMPLGSRRPILQPAAAGGRVAPQLTGDCRGCPPEATPNRLYGIALHPQQCDLLALHQ